MMVVLGLFSFFAAQEGLARRDLPYAREVNPLVPITACLTAAIAVHLTAVITTYLAAVIIGFDCGHKKGRAVMHFARRLGHSWFGRGLIIFVAVLILANWLVAMAQESGGTEKSEAPQQGVFSWFIECSGLIGLVILICSIYFVALVARMFVELRMQTAMPPEIIAQCEAMLEQRDFKGIFNVVKEDDSFFSRVLVTGITELPNGLSEAREAMERIGEMLTTDMEKKISPMAVLGTLGPMIGLLGTLSGMIGASGNRPQRRPADQVGPGGQGYFGSPAADVRRRVAFACRHSVFLVLPQSRLGDFRNHNDPCRRVPPPLRPGCPRQAGRRRGNPGGPCQGMKRETSHRCLVPFLVAA